ncbi:MAG: DUF169 domain-containing protein [Streptosporangiaceae bacterium]
MNYPQVADRVVGLLGLGTPPIALTFADQGPEGIPGPPADAPSSCSFWRQAEQGTFFASAADHRNCPIGAMVMGFALPEDVQQQIGKLVGDMCDCHYLSPDEPAQIPSVREQHAGIVYGPLAEATATPDVVLLWADPRQAMLCNEAMGTASWTAGGPSITGRPGCAALPIAMNTGSSAMSFGCAGMRTFTEVADDQLLIAIPGQELDKFVAAFEETSEANKQMLGFYQGQRALFRNGASHAAG